MRSPSSVRSRAPSAIDKEVGRRTRFIRLEKGISQSVLASRIGVTFQQIQKYERGVNRIAIGTLFAIAEALETPVASLLPADPVDASDTKTMRALVEAHNELLSIYQRLNSASRRAWCAVGRAMIAERTKRSSVRRARD